MWIACLVLTWPRIASCEPDLTTLQPTMNVPFGSVDRRVGGPAKWVNVSYSLAENAGAGTVVVMGTSWRGLSETSQTWIEHVAQAVAQQVERPDGDEDGQSGKGDIPGRPADVAVGRVQQ